MTQKELKTLKRGDIVVHKKSGEKFRFKNLTIMYDRIPPYLTNKRLVAVCDVAYPHGIRHYFEAKEIRKDDQDENVA